MTSNTPITGKGFVIWEDWCEFREPIRPIDDDLRRAICIWLRFHQIDPTRVPYPAKIERRPNSVWVSSYSILDEKGKHLTYYDSDGYLALKTETYEIAEETPPLPFPGFGFFKMLERLAPKFLEEQISYYGFTTVMD